MGALFLWRVAFERDQLDVQRPAGEPDLESGGHRAVEHGAELPAEPASASAEHADRRSEQLSEPHDRGQSADHARPYGTAGRNTATAPATFQTDVRLQKNFPLHWEKSRLEFQAECFNLLNKTNFAAPNANRSNSNFGTITSAYAPRIMQFALRFAF